MAALPPSIYPEPGGLVISLPAAAPTSKVRVKRPCAGFQSKPLATRQTAFSPEDYLEWQISYSRELAVLVQHAKDSGWLSARHFARLRRLASGQVKERGIKEFERILENEENANMFPPAQEHGFRRIVRLMPRYVKVCKNCAVEVQISPRQRAFGDQAMIYLCIPIKFCADEDGASPINRVARVKEHLKFKVQRNNADMIKDTVIAFILASQKHRRDIHRILERMK